MLYLTIKSSLAIKDCTLVYHHTALNCCTLTLLTFGFFFRIFLGYLKTSNKHLVEFVDALYISNWLNALIHHHYFAVKTTVMLIAATIISTPPQCHQCTIFLTFQSLQYVNSAPTGATVQGTESNHVQFNRKKAFIFIYKRTRGVSRKRQALLVMKKFTVDIKHFTANFSCKHGWVPCH